MDSLKIDTRDCSPTVRTFPCSNVGLFIWFWQLRTNKRTHESFDSSKWFSAKTAKNPKHQETTS